MSFEEVDSRGWKTYYPKLAAPAHKLVLGRITDPESIGLPVWSHGFDLRQEADGRMFAVGILQDCYVFVQPKKWAQHSTNNGVDPVQNFGVNMQSLHGAMNGTLQTNDPNFSPIAGASASTAAGGKCSPSADSSSYLIPLALAAVAVVIVFAKLFAPKR